MPTFPSLTWAQNTADAIEAKGLAIRAVACEVAGVTYVCILDDVMGWTVITAADVEEAGPSCLASYQALCDAGSSLGEDDADVLRFVADKLGETVSTAGGTTYASIQEIEAAAEEAARRGGFDLLHVKRLDDGRIQVGRKIVDDEDIADEDEAASAELDPRLAALGLRPQGGHLDEVGSYFVFTAK
jgi:hypothetical protein